MTLHVRDLPVEPSSGVVLYCTNCGDTFSATRGDYFAADPDTELVHCDYDMVLARRRVYYLPIQHQEAEEASDGTTN